MERLLQSLRSAVKVLIGTSDVHVNDSDLFFEVLST